MAPSPGHELEKMVQEDLSLFPISPFLKNAAYLVPSDNFDSHGVRTLELENYSLTCIETHSIDLLERGVFVGEINRFCFLHGGILK